MPPCFLTAKSPVSLGSSQCGKSCLICMCVCVCVGRGGDAKTWRWKDAGIPRWKSVEIRRAERISDSLLSQTDGCRGKRERRQRVHDGVENDLWEERNEWGGTRRVGVGPLGEVKERMQSQVTFSRERSCEHSGRRVTVESSALYTKSQFLSRCLHPAQVCNNKAN